MKQRDANDLKIKCPRLFATCGETTTSLSELGRKNTRWRSHLCFVACSLYGDPVLDEAAMHEAGTALERPSPSSLPPPDSATAHKKVLY